jgi:redox-sensitive bicupin YhaK (pirin superfamily)
VSNLERTPSPELCAAADHPAPTLVAYPARTSPLGDGLVVRRLLPTRARRLVGPWCFLDHYGPLAFGADARPMRVGGHPHIGLQTVSWLLEGEVLHRDSLGSEVLVRPGELSLMTAGRGIAHSEETPGEHSGRLHGVQLWIALPEAERACEPRFEHHAALPRLERPGGSATVFVGALGPAASPARTPWPAVGAELRVASELDVPLDPAHEHALVVLAGRPSVDGQALEPDQLYDLGRGRPGLRLTASDDARALLIGGLPLDEPVLMWWNFVARTADELERAREDWEARRAFGEVPGERLAAPPFGARPVNRPRDDRPGT